MASRDRISIEYLCALCRRALALRDAAMYSATAEELNRWEWDIRSFVGQAEQEWPFAPHYGVIVCVSDGWNLVRYDDRPMDEAMRKMRGFYRL
ncbi:hypothetical protein [Bradyrhizobium sp. WSM1417]|uniref:hypothetical protein n=1 Tax=Bradyrhizobium sp. WSM1417 TaxID=754500 RepID=UPI000489BB7C|nr:hypothetical protein [Bradyrhizobium sp. WSM1417]